LQNHFVKITKHFPLLQTNPASQKPQAIQITSHFVPQWVFSAPLTLFSGWSNFGTPSALLQQQRAAEAHSGARLICSQGLLSSSDSTAANRSLDQHP